MIINKENVDIANELRVLVQQRTKTISDGEGVAMVLLWSFFHDHARAHGTDLVTIARAIFDEFADTAHECISCEQAH